MIKELLNYYIPWPADILLGIMWVFGTLVGFMVGRTWPTASQKSQDMSPSIRNTSPEKRDNET